MNVENTRGAIAGVNVVLTIGLLLLGYFTFWRKHVPPPDESVPAYLPTNHQLPMVTNKADPIGQYQVIWQALDKEPPAPPVVPSPVPSPTITDLESKCKLILISVDTKGDSKSNNCIIEAKQPIPGYDAKELQQTLYVGDNIFPPLNQFKILSIEAREEGSGRIAIVTLEDTSRNVNGSHPVSTIKFSTN